MRQSSNGYTRVPQVGPVELSDVARPEHGQSIIEAWDRVLKSAGSNLLDYFQRFFAINQLSEDRLTDTQRKWRDEERQRIQYDDRLDILYRVYRYQRLKRG